MTIAEPTSDHIPVTPELRGHVADRLQGGFRALRAHAPQGASPWVLQTCSLSLLGLHEGLCSAYLLQIFIVVSFLHTLLQQGPQLARVLETEPQSLQMAEGYLVEHLPKENPQREPHIESISG